PALQRAAALRHLGAEGRIALWRGHHRRGRRLTSAERDRTGSGPLSGRACGEDRRHAGRLSRTVMGKLINGVWHDVWYDTKSTGGKCERESAGFRNWITADGSAGPTGQDAFKAEAGRYHLYVSLACPWAHRTLIFRTIKGLEDMISLSVVN